MKHPISEFWNIANSKIYKKVGEIQHDLKCQLELTIEELQQLDFKKFCMKHDIPPSSAVLKTFSEIKDEILGENQT